MPKREKRENPWLRVAEVARLTELSPKVVRGLVDSGQMPSIRTAGGPRQAGHRLVHIDTVEAFRLKTGAIRNEAPEAAA